MNDDIVLIGLLFVFYLNGGISITQLLLLLALLSVSGANCGSGGTSGRAHASAAT